MPQKKELAQKQLLFDGFVERSGTSAAGHVSDDEADATDQKQHTRTTSSEGPPSPKEAESVEPIKPDAVVKKPRSDEELESDAIDDDTIMKIIASRQQFPPAMVVSHGALPPAETVTESVEQYPRQQQRTESSVLSDEDRAIKIINFRQQQQQPISLAQSLTAQSLGNSPAETDIVSAEQQAPQQGDGESSGEDEDVAIKIQSQQCQQPPSSSISNVPRSALAAAQPASAMALSIPAGPEHHPTRLPPVKQRLLNTVETIPGPGAVASRDMSQTLLDDDTSVLDTSKSISLSGNGNSTRQLIAAELVSSEIDASQRRRIVEEVRQEFLQEVTPAHVVEFVYQPAAQGLNEVDEDDDRKGEGYVNWSRRIVVTTPVVLVFIVILVALLSLLRRPTKPEHLSSTVELQQAIDAYMVAISTTSNPRASTVAQRYGWPIGAWDVSRITDFSRCFDLNRGLRELEFADEEIAQNFFDADLSDWDVSNAETMYGMFAGTARFSGDISRWNVSKVVDFSYMFHSSSFNGDISEWDTGSAVDMTAMFALNRAFNQPLYWNVSQVEFFDFMFFGTYEYGGDGIDEWDVSRVVGMESAFDGSGLGRVDLSKWDVSSVVDMQYAFSDTCCFVGNTISSWNVSSVVNMQGMFAASGEFEGGNLSAWDVSRVTDMASIFLLTLFDGDVSTWDTSSVEDLSNAFYSSEFSGDVSGWNIAKVTDLTGTFEHCSFDGDLSNWDTSSVESMDYMFAGNCEFTGQGLEEWDTRNVITMQSMFDSTCEFNADISGWDISNVELFDFMFNEALTFDQDLCSWGSLMQDSADVTSMFLDSACPEPGDPVAPNGPYCIVCPENL